MEKAYDVKVLAEMLKAKGIVILEDAAGVALETVFEWLTLSADKSENVYDDLLKAIYPMIKAEIAKQVDKIDGAQG